jgi:hypothetical protein
MVGLGMLVPENQHAPMMLGVPGAFVAGLRGRDGAGEDNPVPYSHVKLSIL